jgi:beta-lactamase regulating signal transducer with metallopeptidase domain
MMAIAADWQIFAQIFVERVANSLVEGIAIALFAWILLGAFGRQNSSTRFTVWLSALMAVVALPLFQNTKEGSASVVAGASHSAFNLPGSWAVYALVAWAMIAGAGLVRIGFSFWRLHRLRQNCAAIDFESLDLVVRDVVRKTLTEFCSGRCVTLYRSDRARVPAAIGFLKPAIILPAWALDELSPIELHVVLLHELAHLRRWDDWTNLAQEILRALFFFHPAVWWIERGLSIEREMACDDFVLAATSSPRAYAQCLVTVAEKSFLRRGLALAQAVVGRMHQTTHRIARILDLDRPAAIKIWKPVFGLVAAFSVVCFISVPHMPRLVAFEQAAPSVLESSASATPTLAIDSARVGAKMIPVTLHAPVSSTSVRRKGVLARTVKPQRRSGDETTAATGTPSKPAPTPTAAPKMVSARADGSSDNVGEPSSVLLVMQTQRVDEYGRVWNICVWRLTVFHPVDREVNKAIFPKSI